MNDNPIPGVDQTVPPQNAVSVYSQDAMDDFPVLKAFQQYIDAEQAKAQKRMTTLCIFFALLMAAGLLLSAQENPRWIRRNCISPDGTTLAFSYKGDIHLF